MRISAFKPSSRLLQITYNAGMRRQDDFSKPTITRLCDLAGAMCTICGDFTGSGSGTTGKAAHICAASEKGPRYNDLPADIARDSYENGIWLCSDCHVLVDGQSGLGQAAEYPVNRLLEIKKKREQTTRDMIGLRLVAAEPTESIRQAISQLFDGILKPRLDVPKAAVAYNP